MKNGEKCCVLAENKPCRHIEFARPSMSGFGIDLDILELLPLGGMKMAT
jgi:hypothetical protein